MNGKYPCTQCDLKGLLLFNSLLHDGYWDVVGRMISQKQIATMVSSGNKKSKEKKRVFLFHFNET